MGGSDGAVEGGGSDSGWPNRAEKRGQGAIRERQRGSGDWGSRLNHRGVIEAEKAD